MISDKTKPLWQSGFYVALASMIFTALFKVMDNITVHNFIKAPDTIILVSAYLIIGAWIGFFSSLPFALFFGKRLVDPAFEKISFGNSKTQIAAVITGFISAIATFFNLWANCIIDPGAVISLSSAVILFTLAYDLVKKQVNFRIIILPLFFVLFGGMMAAYNGSFRITLMGILLMGVVSNGLTAASEIIEQNGTRASDGVNFFIWRFLWLAIFGTIMTVTMANLRGCGGMLVDTIISSLPYFAWFVLTMLFVFLGIGLKLTAKKVGIVSVVLMVLSGQVVLGYIFTLSGNSLIPGLFGDVSAEPSVWIVRAIGAVFLIAGIFQLRKKF